MKWLLTLCLFACVVTLGFASCGPKRDFCPTKNPDPADFTCHENMDATMGTGGQNGGPCDGGPRYICGDVTQCTPCGTP